MARALNKLSARLVTTIGKPGRHSDGGGLYLVVDPSGAKRWLFMFRWDGKLKELGLGGLTSVSLADARAKAESARKLVAAGTNPIEAKRAAKAAKTAAKSFGQVADELIESIAPGFRNKKHLAQWTATLKAYAANLRDMPIADVDTASVLTTLQPIWLAKPEPPASGAE